MHIGRRIFYDKATGNVILDTGERFGNVVERTIYQDFDSYPQLKNRTPADTGVIDLAFGDRAQEFRNAGSYKVNTETKELIIYPRLQIVTDKTEIPADGVTLATISAVLPGGENGEPVTFQVTAEGYVSTPVEVVPINGVAVFEFASEVPGTYTITATSSLYGQNAVQVKGVTV